MFVAWRDLRFARGRFALIASVVTLIAVLVGFLSGLTGGLAERNVSAVLSLPADRLAFTVPADASGPTFADSSVTGRQVAAWSSRPGVTSASPVGIGQGRLTAAGGKQAAVALFAEPDGFGGRATVAPGTLVLSETAAEDLGVAAGSTVSSSGVRYTVAGVEPDSWYSHLPVVRMAPGDQQAAAQRAGGPAGAVGTVIAVRGAGVDWDAADAAAGTTSTSRLGSLTALEAFRSEIGSLLLMVGMLFGISALVVGAFFTVWTMQRSGDVAVLKALGASTRSLLADALGQALVVLLGGVVLGMAVVVVLGLAAGRALPFLLSPLTTALPAGLLVLLGLAGAAVALRSVTSTDPLTALGSHR